MAFGNFSSAIVGRVRRLTSQIKDAQQERTDGLKTMAQSAEVGGTAFALAFLNGRDPNGTVAFHGIPLDLTLAAVAHALGFSGVLRFSRDDDQSYQAHAVGNGAMAVYATRMGTMLGQKSLQSKQQGQTQTTRGELVGEVTGALPPPRYVHGYPAERWTVRRAA
ncbi:MAG: hypothetical protein ABTD50_16525 [Polyangiaceae bacterium]|jgi:hypothetical protein